MNSTAFIEARAAITPGLIERLFPGGEWRQGEYITTNPTRPDRSPGSFSISEGGLYKDFSSGDGGDFIDLLARARGITTLEAAKLIIDAAGGNGHSTATATVPKREKPAAKLATDDDISRLQTQCSSKENQRKYGDLISTARYKNADGLITHCVVRYERAGEKVIRPYYMMKDGKWREGLPPVFPLPLLWLPKIAELPEAGIIVCEGEKSSAAARIHLQSMGCTNILATCWTGGANAWKKSDWSPLHGRRVYLMPDNDEPGRRCMEGIADHLKGKSLEIFWIEPRENGKQGEDAADISVDVFTGMLKNAISLQAIDAAPVLQADAIVSAIWPNVVNRIVPDMLGQCTTEDGFAEVATTCLSEAVVYVPAPIDEFFIRQHDEFYEPDDAGIVWHIIRLIARRLGDFRNLYNGDPRAVDQILKRMKTKTGLDAVHNMIKRSPSLIRMSSEIDPGGLLMTPGGIYDPLKCERVSMLGAVFTKSTNYSPDFDTEPVQFLKFIKSLFDDETVVHRLLDLVAVAIAGKAPVVEKGPVLAGPQAGSGKNQFAESLSAVFGSYFLWVKPEWLYENKNAGDVPQSNISRMVGRLLMFCSEPADHPFNGSLYKTIVSGEAIPTRRQHSTKIHDIFLIGMLFIISNRKPFFHHDNGTRRRIENYEFRKNFSESPDRVVDIGRKIAEKEGPAILGYLMRLACEWGIRGGDIGSLFFSQTVDQWTQDFLGWGDTIGRFVFDELEKDVNSRESVSDVWRRYKLWAESNGESIISTRALGEALHERGVPRKRYNDGVRFMGVRLKLG